MSHNDVKENMNSEPDMDDDGEPIVKFPHKKCTCLTEECKCKERIRTYVV